MNNRFFTSDTHAHHQRIIILCNRPFDSVEEMNTVMADNINSVVGRNDRLIHLGDFSYGGLEEITEWRNRLVCQDVVLVLGNHDKYLRKSKTLQRELFTKVVSELFISIAGRKTHIYHFPIVEYDHWYGGGWHLHGHVHVNKPCKTYEDLTGRSLDLAVDIHGFMPLHEDEVAAIITKQMESANVE